MKQNLFILSAIIVVSAFFSSCKKEYLIDVNGTVSGKVYDQYHRPIEKALVVVEGTELKDSTDAEGSYQIKNVPLGSHAVSIKKEGFMTQRSMISITSQYDDAITNKKQSYDVSVTLDGKLYALTGKAKGYVIYGGRPVANAKVVAYWSNREMNNYVTETFETTTDQDGIFNFAGLPLIDYTEDYYAGNVTIAAYDPSNTDASGSLTLYNTGVIKSYQINISSSSLDDISFSGNQVMVDTVAANSNLTVTFNQNVSSEITAKMGGYVTLYNYNTYYKVAATVSYSNNKIIVTPLANLKPGTRYELEFNVYATEFKQAYGSYYFTTVTSPSKAMTVQPVLKINTVSTSHYLKLTTTTPNAYGYEIWASLDGGKTDYVLVDTDYGYSIDLNSTNGYYISSSYPSGTKFYVVPYNNTGLNGARVYGQASAIVTKP